MSRYNKLPFERGRSAFQNQATSDWDITSLAHLEGQKVYLPNIDPANPEVRRNGTDVVDVIVRNDSGAALTPGTPLWWKTGYHGTRVDHTAAGADNPICGFVDDHLPSGGVQDDDLFYMVVEGPVLAKTRTGGTGHATVDGNAVLQEGGLVTNAATTEGTIEAAAALADADGNEATIQWNICGRVIASGNTVLGTDTLINVKLNA